MSVLMAAAPLSGVLHALEKAASESCVLFRFAGRKSAHEKHHRRTLVRNAMRKRGDHFTLGASRFSRSVCVSGPGLPLFEEAAAPPPFSCGRRPERRKRKTQSERAD
ncbi:hypothetical protein MRX96_056127 [Rhipicephalus microplus]